jgi:hypothetical protein
VELPEASVNVAVQVWLTPAVSLLWSRSPQPCGFETESPAFGVMLNRTVTGTWYQPLLHVVNPLPFGPHE